MIDKIKNNSVLSQFIEETCCENEICVSFDEGILPENYVIIKVDKFYNSQNLAHTPASIDCLIIRNCVNLGFGVTLVELKDISTASNFDLNNLKEKFETTLNDFMKKQFKELLDKEYLDFKLYFVSKIEIHKRDLGLKLEMLMNTRFKFNEKVLMIQPKMPTPTIKNCY